MRQVFILVLAILCLEPIAAQKTARVIILVKDSVNNMPLASASVMVTRAKDSIMAVASRTDSSGKSIMKVPVPGKYLLNIFYSGFSDFIQPLHLSDDTQFVTVNVALSPRDNILHEVTVRNGIRKIRIKGDTVEYRADSFLTNKHANVEELLKNLPGFQVDNQGKIQANGKKVEKILVGGEEYFSEDPTLVTKSLKAQMVQKVQLYEQKSDQAIFSKMNDGRSAQALNLELKPENQKGYFGKMHLSFGNSGFYNEQIMASRFKGKEKTAGYFLVSNTGTTGLSWQDQGAYSDYTLSAEEETGNSKPSGSVLDDWDGQYHNQGIPSLAAGGLQYSNKTKSGISVNGSGKYGHLVINSSTISDLQYQLNDTLYSRHQKVQSNNSGNTFKGVFKTTTPLSKNSDVVIGLDVGTNSRKIYNLTQANLSNDFEGSLNGQFRKIEMSGDDKRINTSVLWRVRMKKGVNFSLNGKFNGYTASYHGYVLSIDSFYQHAQVSNIDSTDQFKTDNYSGNAISEKGTLTIPLSLWDWIGFSVGYSHYNNQRAIRSLQKDPAGNYADVISLYSNSYQMGGSNFFIGVDYGLNKRKVDLDIELDAGRAILRQQSDNGQPGDRSFRLLYPSIAFTYSFSSQHKLVAYYSGKPMIPRVDQLQPVDNNTDPLNQQTGNPGLSAAYSHLLNIQYYYFITDKDVSISGGALVHKLQNGFSTKEWIDNSGKRSYAWINLAGNKDASLFAYFDAKPIKQWLDFGVNIQLNTATYSKIINNQLSKNHTSSVGFTVTPKLYQKDFFEFENRITCRITDSKYGSFGSKNTSFCNWIWEPAASFDISPGITLKSDFYYTRFPADTYYGGAQSIATLNASITYGCFRQKQMEVRIACYDILKNNKGVTRTAYDNYTTQTQYNTIGNYWLFSLQYYFSRSDKTKRQ